MSFAAACWPAGSPLLDAPQVRVAQGWIEATPASPGMAAEVLQAVLADGDALPPQRALPVARNGMLVAERYGREARMEHPRRINRAIGDLVARMVGAAA